MLERSAVTSIPDTGKIIGHNSIVSSKIKHHFVSRFYMKNFRSAPKRIHLLNLASGSAHLHASLKNQCYKNRFHGKSPEVEDAFAELESGVAPIIQRIISSQALPPTTSEEHLALLTLIASQAIRTVKEANRIQESIDKFVKTAFSHSEVPGGMDLDKFRLTFENPVFVMLQQLPELLFSIDDLALHLLHLPASETEFVTSDNPVVRHNVFAEGISGVGTRGLLHRGILLFLPISPRACLMLYDADVYKISPRHGRCTPVIDRRDIVWLNRLQALNADHNVYFSSNHQADQIRKDVDWAAKLRKVEQVRVTELVSADEPETRSLIHVSDEWPDPRLRLSFLGLKRRAERIPLQERATAYRKKLPPDDFDDPMYSHEGESQSRLFVSRDQIKSPKPGGE